MAHGKYLRGSGAVMSLGGVPRLPERVVISALATAEKTGVLFVSSPEQPGADTFIHALIMRGLDRSRFDVHVACSAGTPGARTPAFEALLKIPDLHVRPADFGPSLSGRSKIEQTTLL